jgi:lambda repressor-like predicted transcriptional regulator
VEPEDLRKLVARNVRAAARRKGVALTSLADFSGTSRSQLFAVLALTTSPTVDWLAKVAAALDVDPWQLLAPRMKRTDGIG